MLLLLLVVVGPLLVLGMMLVHVLLMLGMMLVHVRLVLPCGLHRWDRARRSQLQLLPAHAILVRQLLLPGWKQPVVRQGIQRCRKAW